RPVNHRCRQKLTYPRHSLEPPSLEHYVVEAQLTITNKLLLLDQRFVFVQLVLSQHMVMRVKKLLTILNVITRKLQRY
ncbi:hypothetical protein AB4158_25345, partial [Vibrio splendidus]